MTEVFGADTLVMDITNAMILDFRARRRGGNIPLDDRPGRPVAAQTVNRDLAYLQAALNHMRDVHGQPFPALAFKRLRVPEPEHRVRFAAAEEFERLMTAAHASLRPIILTAVTTGLRRGNILAMKWHQVDLAGGTITIPRSKGRKPIIARFGAPLRAALARTPADGRTGPVFDTTNFRRRWAAALKDAKMVDFRFHDLRHTFGSWARQNGADLADICEALAHSSVSVTMRYAHVKPIGQTTAFDRVSALLTPKKKRKRA
ncbi:MAG: hypothetical protein BGP16_12745 [Sphingobium sp. 66-54]|nr:MAG: hypothetical protein BGP16_12745 [Sphingobium sp. 66-54]